MLKRTKLLTVAACTVMLSAAGSMSAMEPPSMADLQAKGQELMTWYQAASPEEREPENLAAKVDEIFGAIDLSELDMAGIQFVSRYAGASENLQAKVKDRLLELAADPGVDGAVAASSALGMSFGDSAAMKDALLRTINHPAFAEALKSGQAGDVFGMMPYIPDPTLAEIKDEVLGLAKYFEEDLPGEMVVQAGPAYITAVAKLYKSVTPEQHEKIRTLILDKITAAAANVEDERTKAMYDSQIEFMNSTLAKGKLFGHEAPDMHFTNVYGGDYTKLSDLKGKVVVVDFWATWCGPCIASFPHIREFVERYNGYDVVTVGVTSIQGRHFPGGGQPPVDCTDDPAKEQELMKTFMSDLDMTWNVAFSEEQVFNPDYGVRGIPHMAIIDAEGKVRYNGLHPSAVTLAQKSAMVDALLEEAGLPAPAPLAEEAEDEAKGG